jgi:hypothetical protein
LSKGEGQQAEGQGDQAETEFEKAFDEFAEGKGTDATASDTKNPDADDNDGDGAEGAGQESNDDPNANKDDDKDPATGTDAAASGDGKGQDNKDDAGKKKDGEDAQGASDAATLSADELAKLDPKTRNAYVALQEQNARLQQRESVHKGRVSALSRLNHLSDKIGRLQTSGANSTAVKKEVNAYLESESFKKFKETNPELAEPFEALAATMTTVTGALADDVTRVATEARADVGKSHVDFVYEQHPDYHKVVGSRDTDQGKAQAKKFVDWVATQPSWVRKVVEENGAGVVDAGDVVEVVDRYKRMHAQEFPEFNGVGKGREPAGKGGDAGAGHSATDPDKTLRERRRQAGTSVQNSNAGAGSGAPNDFDAAFEHFAEKATRKMKRA